MTQAPADRSQWQIVPTVPRPFPAELRDADTLVQHCPAPVPAPVTGLGVVLILGVGLAGRRLVRSTA